MRVKCIHGFFIFTEFRVGQMSDFMSLTKLSLGAKDDYFTFTDLVNAPNYSLVGKAFNGFTALATFEGKPWDVFEQNGIVYDINTGTLKLIASILTTVKINRAGNKFTSPGLIQPGAYDQSNGFQVKDYTAYFSRETLQWLYSEVTYV